MYVSKHLLVSFSQHTYKEVYNHHLILGTVEFLFPMSKDVLGLNYLSPTNKKKRKKKGASFSNVERNLKFEFFIVLDKKEH